MNLKEYGLDESIVLVELKKYLDHDSLYKKSNIFINILEKMSRYSAYFLFGLALSSYIFLYYYEGNNEIIEAIDSLSIIDGILFFMLAQLTISLTVILIREIFILLMKGIYKEDFSNYIHVSDSDIMKVSNKLMKLDPEIEREVIKAINSIKYKNNSVYILFTSGINKKIIYALLQLEMKSKILNFRKSTEIPHS